MKACYILIEHGSEYSVPELVDMHLVLCECDGNTTDAVRTNYNHIRNKVYFTHFYIPFYLFQASQKEMELNNGIIYQKLNTNITAHIVTYFGRT